MVEYTHTHFWAALGGKYLAGTKHRHFLMWAVIMHSTVDITPYMSKA